MERQTGERMETCSNKIKQTTCKMHAPRQTHLCSCATSL